MSPDVPAAAVRHQGRADGALSAGLTDLRRDRPAQAPARPHRRHRRRAAAAREPACADRRVRSASSRATARSTGPSARRRSCAGCRASNPGPLPAEAVAHLFTEVISACRALEEALSVAFLGPRGTFSEEAALKHFGGAGAMACRAPRSTRCSGRSRPQQVGLRRRAGGKLHRRRGRPHARSAARHARADLRRGPAAGASVPDEQGRLDRRRRSKIYAHAQSLAQCHEWLNQQLPRSERVPVVSNAEGARLAAEEPSAGCHRFAGRGRALRAQRARCQHRGSAQQHDALRGHRQPGSRALGPRQDLARDVGAQPSRRDA